MWQRLAGRPSSTGTATSALTSSSTVTAQDGGEARSASGSRPTGTRIRRRVTGPTKTAVLEAMAELREELGRAPRSSRTYTVAEAVASWLDDGLPGRSERTKAIYKDGLAPLLAKIGHRPLRDLTALEVRKGLEGCLASSRPAASRLAGTPGSGP